MDRQINLLIILLLITIGCSEETHNKDNNRGVETQEIKLNNKCNEQIKYYLNGHKQEQGKVCDGKKVEIWKEWYLDGTEKWEGEYIGGVRSCNFNTTPSNCKIEFKNVSVYEGLKINKEYHLRVFVKGIHPDDLIIGVNNGVIKSSEIKEEYDFILKPEKAKPLKIYVFIEIKGIKVKICEEEFDINLSA